MGHAPGNPPTKGKCDHRRSRSPSTAEETDLDLLVYRSQTRHTMLVC